MGMTQGKARPAREPTAADDAALVARIVGGERAAFEQLMRRHNTALFRTARAILRDDADAEDALQEAYLAAYRHLGEFRGDARLTTWLTRIVINQALGRLRARRRDNVVELLGETSHETPPAMERAMDDGQVESRRRAPCARSCAACSSARSTRCHSRSAPRSSCAKSRR
jgi:RNA polymerase sigma factor (sigma-70 family)